MALRVRSIFKVFLIFYASADILAQAFVARDGGRQAVLLLASGGEYTSLLPTASRNHLLFLLLAGRQVFREFLKQEFSEENILFWNAVNELQNTNETNPLLVEEKARMIYEDFISILSPREVSLDSIAREIVNRKMVHPDKWTFNEAQEQIFMLMKRDSYPRFIISPLYKRLFNSTSSPTPQA
ncbi:PREDICTED: regulator of G-protein signaling 20-like [Priapulus caudatus]|uniref:Regulator of G-protein signaling 20-like n=1 Tax=Priapulus caudatus TaxID=37621 RepID=A0ABM1E7B9_PRICU|nr:PREDICTED: regulator of G-protein signaling 20-like [Priapulus caudatus]